MAEGNPTTPPQGWYLNPDDQSQYRWWSGSEWTDHTRPVQAAAAASPAPPATQSPTAMATEHDGAVLMRLDPPESLKTKAWITIILIGAVAVAALFGIFEALDAYRQLGDGEDSASLGDPPVGWGIASFISLLAGIIGAFWFHRAYRNLQRRGYQLRFSTGSAGWSWFVPIFNFVRPKGIINDLWRAEKDGVDPQEGKRIWDLQSVAGWIHWWWALWLVSGLLMGVSSGMFPGQEPNSSTITGLSESEASLAEWAQLLMALGLILHIGAACLCIRFIHFITGRQEGVRLERLRNGG